MNRMSDGASNDVLAALRVATAKRHEALDMGLPLAAPAPSLADYRDHLTMLRAWLAPLERWLAHFQDGPQGAEAPCAVQRTPLLDADLAHPSLPAAGAPAIHIDAAPWPEHASAAYRWGVCYVVEGAQLGGTVLHQRLGAALAPHPLDYLSGRDVAPGPRWRAFIQAMRAAVHSPSDIDDACAGACAAFDRILALRAHPATGAA